MNQKRQTGRLEDWKAGSASFHSSRRPSFRPSGFTLLEILLAVTILALVVTAVYGTWNAALTAWKRGSAVADTFQRQRVVMDALSELCGSVIFSGGNMPLYQVTGAHNESVGDTVSFVTASDMFLPPSEATVAGLRRVTIGMDQDERGSPFLALINTSALADDDGAAQAKHHVLSTDVAGFTVRYRDPRDGNWKDTWTEVSVPPNALEFTVTFTDSSGAAPTLQVTRAVELPSALYAMQNSGVAANLGNTTNTVPRRVTNTTAASVPTMGGGR